MFWQCADGAAGGLLLSVRVFVDPVVAKAARVALLAGGYTPTLIVGDGAAGHPGNAPYDRIIATCSAPSIPVPWITQLRPGGLLLTNLRRDLGGGALALLRRDGHGQMQGSFLAHYGGFMPVRSDPPADAQHRLADAFATDDTQTSSRPSDVAAEDLDHPDFGMLAALRLPGVTSLWFEPITGRQRWLLADGSWASVDEGTQTVTQYGPHRLWDTVEALYRRWTDAGKPTQDRFGLSVTASGVHRFWLDSPETVWWSDPADDDVSGGHGS